MVPEFPLPTVDADFYKSQMRQLPPIFGFTTSVPRLAEPTTFLADLDNSIADSIRSNCLENAVKRAAIRQRNLVKNAKFVARPQSVMCTVGSMTAAAAFTSLVATY